MNQKKPEQKNETDQINLRDALERLDNDRELLEEIIILYIEDTTQQLLNLKKLIENKNEAEIARFAHTLKGSSSNIGAEFMRRVAYEMEIAAKNGEIGTVEKLCDDLEKNFEKLKSFLKNSNFLDTISG